MLSLQLIVFLLVSCVCVEANRGWCWEWHRKQPGKTFQTKKTTPNALSGNNVCSVQAGKGSTACDFFPTGWTREFEESPLQYWNTSFAGTYAFACKGTLCTDNIDYYQYNSCMSAEGVTLLRGCLEQFNAFHSKPKPNFSAITSNKSPCGGADLHPSTEAAPVDSASDTSDTTDVAASADSNGSQFAYLIPFFLCRVLQM